LRSSIPRNNPNSSQNPHIVQRYLKYAIIRGTDDRKGRPYVRIFMWLAVVGRVRIIMLVDP